MAYEMRSSDWSSDVCSSDLAAKSTRNSVCSPMCRTRENDEPSGAAPTATELELRLGRLVSVSPTSCVFAADPAISDRKSVGQGKGVSGRVDLGVRRIITTKKTESYNTQINEKKHKDN